MKLPKANWQGRGEIGRLLATLGAEEGETRYVGGCVRDTLLGLPVSDVDLATRLAPAEVTRRLGEAGIKAVPTGIAHGTVTAIVRGRPVEITTLRRDVATDGRRATIAFTGDWREDAARRDFTINALSADPASGEIFDYFGGEDDLQTGLVRFIGDPLTRIAEDHLRILRFFRFHARFGKSEPDAAALDACAARANDLMALSRERIADELGKLLALSDPGATIDLMEKRGIFTPVLPEIAARGVEALRRLIRREALIGEAPDIPRRLAALLPQTEEVARAVGSRLRLSNDWKARLEEYSHPGDRVREPRALAYRFGAERALSLLLLDEIDDEELARQAEQIRGRQPPRFPIKGRDLIALGLAPGPLVARTLQAVEQAWIEGGFSDDSEKVEALARERVAQALRSSQ